MRSKSDDIRKRIEKRKKERERMVKNIENRLPWAEDEERYGFERLSSIESSPDEGSHPLFKKEVFMFKILFSAILVLVVAIMFRNQTPALDPARQFVATTMEQNFQFAAISNWYETTFGEQLALLPTSDSTDEGETKSASTTSEYALPASGKISEPFDDNGQRITIETDTNANVEAINGGFVVFVGEKDGFGKTVVVQHRDNSESWYGNLNDINVSLYEFIDKGTTVGKSTDDANNSKGSFYFAIKQNEKFIDPIQVIQFE